MSNNNRSENGKYDVLDHMNATVSEPTLSESLGDTDPVAQTLTKLTAQRDEYRQHMERYQDEVKKLKAENAAFVKAFGKLALATENEMKILTNNGH